MVTIEQDEWVQSLAEQHRAAPSEYQILKALCEKLNDVPNNKGLSPFDDILNDATVCWYLDTSGDPKRCIASHLYGRKDSGNDNCSGNIVLIMNLMDDKRDAAEDTSTRLESTRKIAKQIVRSAQTRGISTLKKKCSLMVAAGQDKEGLAVTMIQHFLYQNRLIPSLQAFTR